MDVEEGAEAGQIDGDPVAAILVGLDAVVAQLDEGAPATAAPAKGEPLLEELRVVDVVGGLALEPPWRGAGSKAKVDAGLGGVRCPGDRVVAAVPGEVEAGAATGDAARERGGDELVRDGVEVCASVNAGSGNRRRAQPGGKNSSLAGREARPGQG